METEAPAALLLKGIDNFGQITGYAFPYALTTILQTTLRVLVVAPNKVVIEV